MTHEQQVPSGWAMVGLSEVAALGPKVDVSDLRDEQMVHFVPMAAVSEDFGGIDTTQLRPLSEVRKGYTSFAEGDVLFAKITPCMENGKGGVVPTLPQGYAFGSTEFHVIRSHETVTPSWLAHFLSQPLFRRVARQNMTGSAGQLRVPTKWLASVKTPVPPLAEQTRIVAKLEELLSDLDAGVAELKTAQAKLAQYRQSLLKAAVEGTLTADWRARHTPQQTGAQLLARVLDERRVRWEARQLARFQSQGKTPPKGWQSKYPDPVAPDTRDLRQLPEGWVWASVDQLADIGTGVTPLRSNNSYFQDGTIPWVTSGALNAESITEASSYVTELALQECRLTLYPAGSLLIAMYGEGKTRGKCSELGIPATINQAIAAVVLEPAASYCKPFIKTFLWHSYEKMREQASGGVQPNLNLQIVRSIAVPLPPLDEQARIAEALTTQLEACKSQEEVTERALKQSVAQRQNLLKAAFSGQLVPQDPADEPASVLLGRIRAEHTASSATKKRPTRRVSHA